MIDPTGWLDWAERVPGHPEKTNGGRSPAAGFVAHSAEGWEGYLRSNPPLHPSIGGRKSWHFSNLVSGKLLQHYPIYSQCWASGAGFPNNNYVAMEHEGVAGQILTEQQIDTTARVIAEISTLKGWEPTRQSNLWEHNECTRWGALPTACPSNRIPWDKVLAELQPPEPQKPRRRDMFIYTDPNGAAYLIAAHVTAWIPDAQKYTELYNLIYGNAPAPLSQETIDWLHGQEVNGQSQGVRFARVF